MDLLHIVDRLEELVAAAQKMPISNRAIVDRRRLLDIIDQMRITIPQEVREASEILEHHEELRREAEEEARAIVARAEEDARRLVEAHEVTRAARRRADEIAALAEARLEERIAEANDEIRARIEESRTIASQQMDAADDYAREMLHRLRRQMDAFTRSIDAGLRQLEPVSEEARTPDASAEASPGARPHAAARGEEPRLHELPRAQPVHHAGAADGSGTGTDADHSHRRDEGDAAATGGGTIAADAESHAAGSDSARFAPRATPAPDGDAAGERADATGERASVGVHAAASRGGASRDDRAGDDARGNETPGGHAPGNDVPVPGNDVPAASTAGDGHARAEHADEAAPHGEPERREPEHRQEPARFAAAQQEAQQARAAGSWRRVESGGLSAASGSSPGGASTSEHSREPVPLRRPEPLHPSPSAGGWGRRREGVASGPGASGDESAEDGEVIDDLATPALDDDPSRLRRRAEED